MKYSHWMPLLFPVLLQFGIQQCFPQSAQRQTTFCEDGAPDEFTLKAESIPKTVVEAVMNTAEGKQARDDAERAGREPHPEQTLRATTIRLSPKVATMFLVMGSSYPLAAADASWFWVVREDRTKASVLLWAAGNCVTLKSTDARGYRDIEVVWASAGTKRTETYRFDGTVYKLASSSIKDRGPND